MRYKAISCYALCHFCCLCGETIPADGVFRLESDSNIALVENGRFTQEADKEIGKINRYPRRG
jgi:hypothetical protein